MIETTTKITCDGCGNVIEPGEGRPGYHLVLKVQNYRRHTGFEYLVEVTPPLDRDHHFHGEACLAQWVAERGQKIEGARRGDNQH